MKIAVIGAGMIGSAAARHLARAGHETVLIGPREPSNKADHRGVFASHYDAGRITRSLDPDPFWAQASAASIARYAELEADSGIRFYTEKGLLMTGPSRHKALTWSESVALQKGYEFRSYMAGALAVRFPEFAFASTTRGLFEPKGAGYIDPRAMVAAQIKLGQMAGATVIPEIATGLRETSDGVEVETEGGTVTADRALVAAGGFTNMVLPEPVPITVLARTILMAEVSERDAARLDGMPPLIHYFDDGRDLYLLPPIRYPNGRYYLKIGGDPKDVPLDGIGEIKAWFRRGGDTVVASTLDDMLRALLPTTELGLCHVAACVTTYTDGQRPVLERMSKRLAVATAGCGRGAKCCDELGRLGAETVLGHELPGWVYLPRPKELSAQ